MNHRQLQRTVSRCLRTTLYVTLAATAPVQAEDPPFQSLPLTLSTSDVLPRSMLSGEGFSVAEKVSNDGFVNTYTLRTDNYGEMRVVGSDHLRARIQEIKATQALEKLERSDEFAAAAKDSVSGVAKGGKSLVTAPVETTKGAVKGVGRWMGNVGRSVTSDDPHQENVVSTALGHDATKRAYALEFGVDPYTDFEPFQKRLGEVARASTAGGLITSVAVDVATAGTLAGTVVTIGSLADMKEILKDNPPGTLSRINKEKLQAMGVPDHQVDAFLKNYNYTPTGQTLLVEALRRMGDVKGKEIFMAHAASAPDKIVARWMQQAAEMMASFTAKKGAVRIMDLGTESALQTSDGNLVIVIPADYVAWGAVLAEAEQRVSADLEKAGAAKAKELWIEGTVDPVARQGREARGWRVNQSVALASVAKGEKATGGGDASPGVKGATKALQ